MLVNMDAEARASLRHYLSAAMIFPAKVGESVDARQKAHGDAMYERTLAAFDEWFTLVDSRQTEDGARTIHGITMRRDSDGNFDVSGLDRWFCASPANDAEENLEGEVCLLLDRLWQAAAPVGVRVCPRLDVACAELTPAQRCADCVELPAGVREGANG